MFWMSLADHGPRTALFLGDGSEISYAELAARADASAEAARDAIREIAPGFDSDSGPESNSESPRPLALVECANVEASVTAYLACLRAGWPVIPVAEGATRKDPRLIETYRPNLIFREGKAGVGKAGAGETGAGETGWAWEAGDPEPAAMHPDLAVLLSTSGTTGAAKLVRLSRANIAANAASIVEYLAITDRDRAITTLPFHYSYGMSVLHTQLLAGGALILTDASVTEEDFWDLARSGGATSLALVPFQFELLENSGFAERALPSLRYVTQAGGKLSPVLARRFIEIGQAKGWELFVMYGQTEASPRIAYVPPKALSSHPEAIGIPIPGGRLWLADDAGAEITAADTPGELVYEGPNVMLGYAETRAGLAAEAGPEVLRTGDIAERSADGFFRVVGRRSRFLKLVGLRIGLDEVERALAAQGLKPYAVGDDRRMTVFLAGATPETAEATAADLIARYGLTRKLVAVRPLETVPLLSSGKIDYRALNAMAAAETERETEAAEARGAGTRGELETVLRDALRRNEIDLSRSFAEHGGDSLSFLEVQMALNRRLGHVPVNWEKMPLSELMALEPRARAATQPVSIDTIGRVVAITTIVALHAARYPVLGGAYLLIALVGFSMARFQLTPLSEGRIGQVLRTTLVPILIGYYGMLGLVHVALRPISAPWFFLLGNYERDFEYGIEVLWFVGLYVQLMLLMCLPFLFRPVRAFVARKPFELGIGLLVALMVAAPLLRGSVDVDYRVRDPLFAGQLVLLGWLVYFAGEDLRRRLLVTGLVLLDVALFWHLRWSVIALVLGGLLPLLWFRTVRLPWRLAHALTFVAQRTLFIYLTHPFCVMVFVRVFENREPKLAMFLATISASIVTATIAKAAYDMLERRVREWLAARGARDELRAG
ncbi:AMP-binding protein [Amaricoccus sp. W119]|uniref:AMP-binding protein n=1 Tax=Amaricoccus sp. W119 TaxID=3391833 RepID=UPI0039A4E5F0